MSILNERITALRKARGLTQEQLGQKAGVSAQAVSKWEKGGAPDVELLPVLAEELGVTIDALFGLDSGEKLDIAGAIRRWLATVPAERRVDRLCRTVWAAAGAVISPDDPEDIVDISGYENRCESEDTQDGRPVRWLRRTRITTEDGVILGVRANDMSFAIVFPEPEEGWEPYLASNSDYRRLFAVLAKPHALELLEYLHSRPLRSRRRYTPGVIAKVMGLEKAEVESLMAAMADVDILDKAEMETEDGVVNCYLTGSDEVLVPFLYLARWLITDGGGYLNAPYRKSPVLRGEKWREK